MNHTDEEKSNNKKLFKKAVFLTAYSIFFFMLGLSLAQWYFER